MSVSFALAAVFDRADPETAAFRCCDTDFEIRATGIRAGVAVERARATAQRLEARLDAFDESSAVAELNRSGSVEDRHVAALVRRADEYYDRTGGVFDVTHGELEHAVKSFVRGDADSVSGDFADGEVTVEGETVRASRPVDLNGLAKGYVVDRAFDALSGFGRRGFVNGGGDVAGPTGPVGVESPYGDDDPLTVLDTEWNVATSAGYERTRGEIDHIYDPVDGRVGTAHDLVTVVAERDCTEADALATTLAALSLEDALVLAEEWAGAEALVVHQGVFRKTEGFENHVAG